jgi:uncharacterized protein with FMN-binding domain
MQRTVMSVMTAGVLALPVANAVAATRAASSTAGAATAPHKKVTTKKFAGATAQADRWGTVQVTVTVRTTAVTSGGKTRKTRRYTDLGGGYSYHTSRSQFIMSHALPLLREEFLQAQSANVQMISGATYTSQAFEQSLQSALLRARKS